MRAATPRTVLEGLVHAGNRTIDEWCGMFNTLAAQSGTSVTLSPRQLHRWMAGTVIHPHPAAKRVAQQVWKLDYDVLVSPAGAEATRPQGLSTRPDLLDQELRMATDDSARWIRRGAGAVDRTVLDQLHSDVRRFAADYLTRAPLELIPALSVLRRDVFEMIDSRQRPEYLGELYLVAGQLCALLAHACADLGRPHDAEIHARSAWLAADYAHDQHLAAYVRWLQSFIAYWQGDHREAARYADLGLADMTDPSTRLRLASQLARARAAQLEPHAALAALDIALDAVERVGPVDEEPGVMWFHPGKARYYAAEVHLALGGRDHHRLALEHADNALQEFDTDSPAEFVAAAQLDAARAHLGLGDLDAATDRITTVLQLPVERRTTPIIERVTKTAAELTAIAPTTRAARELSERISLFSAYTARPPKE